MIQKTKADLGVAFPEARRSVEGASGPSGIIYAGAARAALENSPSGTPNHSSIEEVERAGWAADPSHSYEGPANREVKSAMDELQSMLL